MTLDTGLLPVHEVVSSETIAKAIIQLGFLSLLWLCALAARLMLVTGSSGFTYFDSAAPGVPSENDRIIALSASMRSVEEVALHCNQIGIPWTICNHSFDLVATTLGKVAHLAIPCMAPKLARPRHTHLFGIPPVVVSPSATNQPYRHRKTTPGSHTQVQRASVDANVDGQRNHQCRSCSAFFSSRSALFRHIRSEHHQETRHTIALLFAYHTNFSRGSKLEVQETMSEAELAGMALHKAMVKAVSLVFSQELQMEVELRDATYTQASVTKLRHKSLSQEVGCAASGDVMVMSFVASAAQSIPVSMGVLPKKQKQVLSRLLLLARELLENSRDFNVNVRLLACKLLPADMQVNAEDSVTQRVYQFLLPLRWLPDGGIEQSFLHTVMVEGASNNSRKMAQWSDNGTNNQNVYLPESLYVLTKALRSAESAVRHVSQRPPSKVPKQVVRYAQRRFESSTFKERLPWHNFADPHLRGDASPNHKPVWRVVDRAAIHSLIPGHHKNDQTLVLEFRGDDFVKEQVRRIVGTALAITHGWLPSNMFDLSTRADLFLETPLAPEGRLYFAEARFNNWDGKRKNGRFDMGMFEDWAGVNEDTPYEALATNASMWIQEQILCQKAFDSALHEEDHWLQELRDIVAPRIRRYLAVLVHGRTLHQSNPTDTALSLQQVDPAPKIFMRTLALLREIVEAGKWPQTSWARSTIIRNFQTVAGAREAKIAKNEKDAHQPLNASAVGSFTLVNRRFRNRTIENVIGPSSLPLGNLLFPALVRAVFDLEVAISEASIEQARAYDSIVTRPSSVSRRSASSHCAINRNAEFTPHVDSGRGAGQTLSMIVGLGDYVGGELAVEGTTYDIRYRALQFDGWKLRHWTNPFVGERFSLVWFTPEAT